MENFMITDFIYKMFYAVVTLLIFFYVLRGRDKLTGVDNFKDKFQKVSDDPKAYATYLGLTAIAVAIVISSFF